MRTFLIFDETTKYLQDCISSILDLALFINHLLNLTSKRCLFLSIHDSPCLDHVLDLLELINLSRASFFLKGESINYLSVLLSSTIRCNMFNNMPWSVATILYFPPLRRKRASLSPRESSRFRPRVFSKKRHFSQKSALKVVKIRALLWAYRGPRERKDAGHTYAHLPR